jgi:hypothetical protein
MVFGDWGVNMALIGIGSSSSGPLPQHRTYGSVYGAWLAIRNDASSSRSTPHQVSSRVASSFSGTIPD